MTTTYDPHHPQYLVEADLREELTRVYDLCHGCRLCFKFCTSFPTLFEMIDEHDDQDAARLTPQQQDQVVDECFGCKLCYVNCPYIPGQSEWALDFPRLMMRATQVRHRKGDRSVRQQLTDQALGRTDLAGRVGGALAPVANAAIGTPESLPRKVMERTVGISAKRILPPFARARFSTWFRKRTAALARPARAKAAIFPTCIVEYQNTSVGKDLVRVYERNGIECSVPDGQVCCGAPMLHQGDLAGFEKLAQTNLPILAAAVRAGNDVVVPQPTCSYVLKQDYVDYVGGPDAELVAASTYDAAEYLWKVHKADDDGLDRDFSGHLPESVTYHAPCHLRAQNIGYKARDVLKLTGTKVAVVAECSAIDGTWGLRAENYDIAKGVARKMADAIRAADSEVIAGDCNLANGGITEEVGQVPVHPLQVLARAYGIPEDD